MQVNVETLQEKIKYLELCKLTPVLGISINEAYQLEAYKMLLQLLKDGARANCHCNCQFWHYDESREQCVCNSCLGVKSHD
ncbi:hypothetical protein phiKDA1_13 (endogenous virus) [Enterobacter phage phiKDA1]|uniref:Uncharacterized protein n=1 Tax=Enterobacter phage phiKDA1 TaxID=1147139 RepID=A0A0A6Z5C8_9CAUD|nr:hypothetical protein HOQ86_gp14 [Enterobacter phage phiKDA1]AFE86106.1 hypothetical protein phiKDA1_13 [Enterobacter phage phiKDA1]